MEKQTWVLIIIAILAVWVINPYGVTDNLFSTASDGSTSGSSGGTTSVSLCPDTSATVKLLSTDKYSPSSAVVGSDTVLTKTGGAWVNYGTYADGSSLTLGIGTDYQVIFRENSTGHYPALVSGIVGYPNGEGTSCTGSQSVKAEVVAYDTTFGSGYITDKDGSLNADGAYNIAAGESATSVFTIPATAKKGFGSQDAGYNVVVCEYNTTEISSFTISDKGSDVVTTTSGVNAPQRYSNNLTGSPGKEVFGFSSLENNENLKFAISIQTDSTHGASPSQDPFCRFYDACIYRDAVTDALTTGIEDTQATTTDKCQTTVHNITWNLS